MRFDVIVIGGGLSGLACGISLAERGRKVAVVSAGQSSIYFNTGCFDLLGYDAAGKPVEKPLEHIAEVPVYAALKDVAALAARAKQLLLDAGVAVSGSASENVWRTTPLGLRRPTWLTVDGVSEDVLPWEKTGPGLSIQKALVRRFRSLGGLVLTGDVACDGGISDGAVTALSTEKLGAGAISAKAYVLASGSFMNRGLAATAEKIWEPVFGVDVVSGPERTVPDVFDAQPYMEFGVAVDARFRVFKSTTSVSSVLDSSVPDSSVPCHSVPSSPCHSERSEESVVANLFACGQILAGNNPVKYGNAEGVQLLTALQVADNIMEDLAL